MAELGLIAAVVQVADVGIRLSIKLYKFGQTVAGADESIVFISKDISQACSIIKTLGHSLENHHEENLYSHHAISTANAIVKDCLEIFQEMDRALLIKTTRMGLDGGSGRAATVALERLKWPFQKPKMMLLWSKLDKLKSSLQLMLNVLIYARLTGQRLEPSTVITDQRVLMKQCPRPRLSQSPNCATSSPPMARNGHKIGTSNPSTATELRFCSLEKVTKVAESPIEGPFTRLMTARELEPATTTVERYCAFIKWLMEEIEADDHGIGRDMRCRLKDDIIRIHKREARMLKAACGHSELKDLMRGKMWRLADMDGEQEFARDPSNIVRGGTDSSPAVLHNRKHDLKPSVNLHGLGPHSCEPANPLPNRTTSRMQKGGSDSSSRRRVFIANIAIDRFLEERDDPWNLESLASECSQSGITDIAEIGSWRPFESLGSSTVASIRYHEVVPVSSFLDIHAVADSTDTEAWVTASSVIDEHACDSQSVFLVESEVNGPLVLIDDQEYSDIFEQDSGESAVVSMYTALEEQVAVRINVV